MPLPPTAFGTSRSQKLGANSSINSIKVFLNLAGRVVFNPYFLTLDCSLPICCFLFSGYIRIAYFCLSLFSVFHILYYSCEVSPSIFFFFHENDFLPS